MAKKLRAASMSEDIYNEAVRIGGGNFTAGVTLAVKMFSALGGEPARNEAKEVDLSLELERGTHPDALAVDKRTRAGRDLYGRYSAMYEMRKQDLP